MQSRARKLLSLLLTLMMVFSLAPVQAFAAEEDGETASVILSDNPVMTGEEKNPAGDSSPEEPPQNDNSAGAFVPRPAVPAFTEQPKAEAGEDGAITVTWKIDSTVERVWVYRCTTNAEWPEEAGEPFYKLTDEEAAARSFTLQPDAENRYRLALWYGAEDDNYVYSADFTLPAASPERGDAKQSGAEGSEPLSQLPSELTDPHAGEPEAHGAPQMKEAAPITTTGLRGFNFTRVPEDGFTIPANGSYTIHWETNFTPVKLVIKKRQYAASIVDPNDPPVLIWESTLVELSGGVSAYPIGWDPDFIDGISSSPGCCYELWAYYSSSEYIVSRFVGISEKPVFIQEPAGGFTIPANGTHRINWETNFAQTGFKIVYSVYVTSITDGSPFLWDQKTVAESSGSQTWFYLPWDAGFSGINAGIYTLYVYYSNGTSGHCIQFDFPGASEARAFTQKPPARIDIPVNGSYTIHWDTNFQCDKYVIQIDTYVIPFDGGTPVHTGETETVAQLSGTQKSYTIDWIHPDKAGQGLFIYNEYTLSAHDSGFVERCTFRINYERPAFTRWPSQAMMTEISPANLNWETNFDIRRVKLYSVYYNGTYDYIFIRNHPAGTMSCQISYNDIQEAYLQGYDKLAIRAYYGSEDDEYVQHVLDISVQNTEGYCGVDNGSYQSWSFDESNGTLTISGTGQMADFTAADIPWMLFRSQIKTVIVGEGVTSVGEYAFYNCSSLTRVDLPSTLDVIGDHAFDNCPALADANINMSQQDFNTTVTWDKTKNTGLRDAEKHFTRIAGGQAGPNLTWMLENSGLLRFAGSGAMYNWSSSESAPWYFYRSSITSVSLANVTTIGSYAFRDCSKLTTVTIPWNLTYLGARAFGSCTGLKSVNWNAPSSTNVTEIPEACFSGCLALQSFTVPGKCTAIGQGAFSGCDALTTVSFTDGSALTSVGKRAFYSCDKLANISLPEGVTSLGDEAFYNCRSLTSFPLPSALTSLGAYCFSGCSGVTGEVSIPAGVSVIPERCFLGCSGFYRLMLTPGVTSVDPYAFYGCTKLTHVDYDGFGAQWEQVTVAYGNTLLTNAIFSWLFRYGTLNGDGVKWSLYGSTGRLEIWGSGAMPNWPGTPQSAPWYQYREYIKTIDVHFGVTRIGAYAFRGYPAVTTVYLPGSLTMVATAAFLGDTSLSDVWYGESELMRQEKLTIDTPNSELLNAQWHYTDIGGSVYGPEGSIDLSWSFNQESGILRVYWDEDQMDQTYMEIPDYRDYRDTPWYQYNQGQLYPLITAVRVDELVTRIGDNAFAGLSDVQEVHISSTVTSIGEGAFMGCGSLVSVVLPDTVETLGDNVFWGCGNLENVTLPDGLTEIPYGTFYACDYLYTVHIPGTVQSIGKYAFSGCTALTDIYFGGTSAQWVAVDLYTGNDPVNSAVIHFIPPEIAVDGANFPDPAFRAYVTEHLDTDRSGWLTDAERYSVGGIYCSGLGIEDLTGIEHFPEFTHLDCSDNMLGGTLDLSGFPQLVSVDASNNQLTGLILTDLTDLKTLIFSGNDTGWSAPDLSTNIALEYLDCGGCDGMEGLDLSANTALTDLNCSWNQLDALDLSANTALQQLDCSHNSLTSLDLSTCTDLRQLSCSDNVLTTLTLGQQTNLITLVCYRNSLASLDLMDSPRLQTAVLTGTRTETAGYVEYRNGADYIQADKSTVLITLSYVLSGLESSATGVSYYDSLGAYRPDGMVQTPVWKDGAAPGFAAFSYSISVISLNEACTEKLQTAPVPAAPYYLRYIMIPSAQAKGLIDFSELSKDDCTLYLPGFASECILVNEQVNSAGNHTAEILFRIVMDTPDGLPIDEAHFPDPTFRAWVAENCDPDRNGYLTDAEREAVKGIDVDSLGADSLSGIEYFCEITALNADFNNLTELDLSSNTALQSVSLFSNKLTSLNLTDLEQLTWLSVEENHTLPVLDLRSNTGLASLWLCGNRLTELDVSMLPDLKELDVSDNELTELDVSANTALMTLYCTSGNELTAMTLGELPALKTLHAYYTALDELDISGCPLLLDAYRSGTRTEDEDTEQYLDGPLAGWLWVDKGTRIVTGEEEELDIAISHSCAFGNNLSIGYLVKVNDLAEYSSFKFIVSGTELTDYDTFTSGGTRYYRFVYSNIAAKQMGHMLTAVFYAEKDGVTYQTAPDEYSVRTYAYNRLANSTNATFKKLMVDMLNYGAAAQVYFGYDTGNLVNADLTEEQRALGTPGAPSLTPTDNTTHLDGATVTFAGKNVGFSNSIELRFYMRFAEEQPTDNVKLVLSYTAADGTAVKKTIPYSEFGDYNSTTKYGTISTISAKDMSAVITAKVHDGNVQISDTLEYSVETYVYNRLQNSTDENFRTLITELMKYGKTAEEYFRSQQH